jgi:SAM-dependent MidA family methyltransferase
MDMSLYHRELGYYMTEKSRTGPHGDYYTSPHLHPIFGWLLANQLDEIKRIMGDPDEFTVLEIGAGKGFLAEGIVDYACRYLNWKGNWKYIIVEQNCYTIEDQKKLLAVYKDRIVWKNSLEEVDQFCGCVISNELLDAFPVHLVEMTDRFQEIFVSADKEGFVEVFAELSTPDLSEYINRYRLPAINGYRTEINLRKWDYFRRLDHILSEGFVISIDYGYTAREYYSPDRNKGTLLCYCKHRVNDNPYANVGKQDITAHVNFTSLKDWGDRLGMKTVGYCPQGIFLASLSDDEIVSREMESNPGFQNELLKIKGLFFGMGDTHKVLIQYKGNQDFKNLKGFDIRNRVKML